METHLPTALWCACKGRGKERRSSPQALRRVRRELFLVTRLLLVLPLLLLPPSQRFLCLFLSLTLPLWLLVLSLLCALPRERSKRRKCFL